MDRQRCIEHDRAGRRLPDPFLDDEAFFHRGDRDVAERVIDEMGRHIDEQHEAGDEPNLPQAGARGNRATQQAHPEAQVQHVAPRRLPRTPPDRALRPSRRAFGLIG